MVKWKLGLAGAVVAATALSVPVATIWWRPAPPVPRPLPPPPPPDPRGIVIHHSATQGSVRGQAVGAVHIGELHRKRGFAIRYRGKLYHIGYHYVIREDGIIETGRPEHCIGAHSKITEYNHYLGICLVGNFSDRANPYRFEPSVPTGQQLSSLVWLCAKLSEKYGFTTSQILRHHDIRQTACPGEKFPYHWLLWQVEGYRPIVRARMDRLAAASSLKPARAYFAASSAGTTQDVNVNE
jgi:N-acetyl-anhydromuramyl-L-alanine amidase AmpD